MSENEMAGWHRDAMNANLGKLAGQKPGVLQFTCKGLDMTVPQNKQTSGIKLLSLRITFMLSLILEEMKFLVFFLLFHFLSLFSSFRNALILSI